ncbi:hypothetical protein ACSS6W_007107 [Trichoderma asperelloides]
MSFEGNTAAVSLMTGKSQVSSMFGTIISKVVELPISFSKEIVSKSLLDHKLCLLQGI